ncbi:hypothetical protein [Vibrio hepatarius]|uniref:hypothetical protein n=1 Tax=Vibrio hepatarius TaxID=171383 RepID=UPI00142D876B|nr:hypothetical protein [Vibrio hepatarius]NIY85557.1 hypothetical protein [Vibrio hepatarius]
MTKKGVLFSTLLALFVLTAAITLLGVLNIIEIGEFYLKGLFAAFLLELAATVFAIAVKGNLLESDEAVRGSNPPVTTWDSAAREISAMEEIYSKKSKSEIEFRTQERLKITKDIAKKTANLKMELELLEVTIKQFIPSKMRALIYARLLKQGEPKDEINVAIFFTTQDEVDEAMRYLLEHEYDEQNS